MRRAGLIFVGLWLAWPAAAQQVVDRIVARIGDDIITLSELRELGRYQQLLNGPPAADSDLLSQLIEQWIVVSEARAAAFPRPNEQQVARQMGSLLQQFASPEAYQARLREVGLGESAVRRLVERQLYLAAYLDYKFRPAVSVEPERIEAYYRDELVPRLTARSQPVPALEQVQERIQELLVQREITARADRWIRETRGRLKIETRLGAQP